MKRSFETPQLEIIDVTDVIMTSGIDMIENEGDGNNVSTDNEGSFVNP